MKLIIESGSTKTDWKYKTPEGIIKSESSMGINPTIQSTGEIKDEQDNILRKLEGVGIKEIEYYGAGCGDNLSKEKIRNVLSVYFSEANIQVESDIVAAYRALFGNESGIVCILGTGSNSALFKNGIIEDSVKSLGYLMGDEGSGSQIGKVLMQDYFRKKTPKEISGILYAHFERSDDELIKEIYRLKYPNRFFARLVKNIISENINNPYIHDLVERQFHLFFHNCLLNYKNQDEEIGFIGSVAFHFKDILTNVATNYRMKIKNVIKQPIDQLILLDN